jgi:hypothetical protein
VREMSIGGKIMKEVEKSINRGRSDISRFLRRTVVAVRFSPSLFS